MKKFLKKHATGKDAPHVTAVLGGSDHVYANHQSLVLAQGDWGWNNFRQGEQQRSIFHKFELALTETNYEASGFVPGMIENQFSMDVKDDILRVTTTEDVQRDADSNPWDTTPENRLFTLEQDDGELVVLDKVPTIIKEMVIVAIQEIQTIVRQMEIVQQEIVEHQVPQEETGVNQVVIQETEMVVLKEEQFSEMPVMQTHSLSMGRVLIP